ncbi:hypothetical protein [Methanoregula sp.]|jgi:hypothetical protein|uniref:hypothetical protein n=1 Tax=Methanoregula sp. TaxID=2052170 RepID=UPI003C29FFAD
MTQIESEEVQPNQTKHGYLFKVIRKIVKPLLWVQIYVGAGFGLLYGLFLCAIGILMLLSPNSSDLSYFGQTGIGAILIVFGACLVVYGYFVVSVIEIKIDSVVQ